MNPRVDDHSDFAATTILETVSGEVNDGGQLVDRHLRDLFVTGSPAQAMRAQFAHQRDDQPAGQRFITLFDPAQMWASGVVKALADASGLPIERLHLRDQATLGTLAMIERTTLPRRLDDTLKVYNADVRTDGDEAGDVPYALMERSDMTVVIVGPMHPSAVQDMIKKLRSACAGPAWRCPQLLFLLPVGATWTADSISLAEWPAGVHVQALTEPLTSASIVWNILLAHWNRIKPLYPAGAPGEGPVVSTPAATGHAPAVPLAAARPGLDSTRGFGSMAAPTDAAGIATAGRDIDTLADGPAAAAPNAVRAAAVLQELMLLDGLIFAALVDASDGQVVASEGRGPDIDRAAVAAAEILRTHRRTLRQMGHWRPNDPVDEVLVTAGSRYHILRTLQAHPDHFILAVLDKLRSNLAITRFRIMEAQQVLI
ncbi:MAG: hypothetical protein ABI574_10145 [Burkholderiales bacterium]